MLHARELTIMVIVKFRSRSIALILFPFENTVVRFHNLYNSQDDGLEFNLLYENRIPLSRLGESLENITLNYYPLGLVGIDGVPTEHIPLNYNETM
jgi:hypothetical protein